MSKEIVNLDAPLFVTWYQCLVSSFICFILSTSSKIAPNFVSLPQGSPMKWDVFHKTPFSQHTSKYSVLCCAVIVSGFWLGVGQENEAGSLSIVGTIFGVLGSLSLSLYSIYTKKVLPIVDQQIWLLSYYNNVYSSIIFIPLILLNNELGEILNYDRLWDLKFWLLMTAGGLCGFSIGYVTTLQIKVTSPLTHNISGTAKACAQTVIAAAWYEDSSSRSWLWWFSNGVVLAGSAAYTRVRQIEMEKAFSMPTQSKEVKL
ncbi:hypothetical protein J437_LFUL017954 [Ladona fulva]|uniref:GDP-fucose transporter 1 n=1 Tax=Ladona fulva TaxID=123851 RepID=A0A8K0P9E1_LADFU|nr:hypothetical protein J437_LFUL017954 [Ladona fulva]